MKLRDIFVNNLKFYRKQRGLTQNELTLAINKSYNYINSVEQGKIVPSLDVIEKISEVLGVAPSVLFSDDSSPKNIKTFWREQYVSDMTDQLFNRLKPILATEIRNSLT